jgi:Dolichyl-phosphate-mannose-protein mannosyltransferase
MVPAARPERPMTESSSPTNWRRRLENRFTADSNLAAGFVLLLAFLLRLCKASGTFLNLDEAMHFLAANKPTLAEAYRASLNLAHPPLLVLLLHAWGKLGTSELFLRLPSVVAGTIFCWIFFRWLTRLLGPAVGWVGLILVSLLPVFVELSSEVRQYPMLLCFMMAAAYVFERALDENSAAKMAAVFVFLYLAMLTHFSAILFAGAVGAYSLSRVATARPSWQIVAIWIAGQAAGVGLFVFLYLSQISKLKGSASAQHMQALLANSYFHRGHDHLLGFIFARTFGVLQYTFGQLVVGDLAGILFIAGVFLLLTGKGVTTSDATKEDVLQSSRPSSRQLALLLMLPFAINAAAAIAYLYPYGGTRHSAFLVPFAVAGVSLTIVKFARRRLVPALGAAVLLVVICQAFGAPHRPYMLRQDQRRSNMNLALDAIRHSVAPDDALFVDFQTSFLLRFYLCPAVSPSGLPSSDFRTYTCSGYRVVSTNSETNVLTADLFLRRYDEMVSAYAFKPGQTIWIFQAGWDIALARQLQENIPEFRDLKTESFGRNISLFKLTVGQPIRGSISPVREGTSGVTSCVAQPYQMVFSSGDLRILSSRVIRAKPSASAVAPIRRSAGSLG